MDHKRWLRRYTHFLAYVTCSLLCACGGGGGGGGGSTGQPTPPKQGSLVIADVDADDDGLIEIATLEQLDWVRNDFAGTSLKDHAGRVNSAGCRVGGCNGYELTTDLDFDTNGDGVLDGRDTYVDYDHNGGNAGWLPIIRLTGNFEGNGHRLLNLFINRPNKDNVGLIEIADSAAGASMVIRNVEIAGPLTSITGKDSTGALVGLATVSGSMQINANKVSGKVAGRGFRAGGLVGQVSVTGGQLTVRDNRSAASVEGVAQGSGGLIGMVFDGSSNPSAVVISRNAATGPVSSMETAGGLLGSATGDITVENCSSSGTVTSVMAGGLIGSVGGKRFTLRNSVSTGGVVRSATSVSNITRTSGGMIGSLEAEQVTIADVRVTAATVSGAAAGGLIGGALLSHGTIDIRNAYADVGVVGGDASLQNMGGLIGVLYVESDGRFNLSDSFANGKLTGKASVGGLVGVMSAKGSGQITIENVFALGNASAEFLVGGLFGSATAADAASITVRNSYAAGAVDASNTSLPFAGGLAGEASADPMSTSSVTFERSYWATDSTGRNNPYGALSARTFSNDVSGAPLSQLACPASANDTSCWTTQLYRLWDAALNSAGQPLWRFSGPGQLPALKLGDAIYQPVMTSGGAFVVSRES